MCCMKNRLLSVQHIFLKCNLNIKIWLLQQRIEDVLSSCVSSI